YHASVPAPASSRRRKWLRRLALLVLTVATAVFVATRPTVLGRMLAGALASHVGGEVNVGEARWLGSGWLELRDVSLRAHDWRERGTEIGYVSRATVRV